MPPTLLDKPRLFEDERGYFHEVFHTGHDQSLEVAAFKQVNIVQSKPGVLRGMHYQHPSPQGKLVTCVAGAIWDVAVDIRPNGHRGVHWAYDLTAENGRRFWIPPGYAHGYCVIGDTPATVLYLCDEPYVEENAKVVAWNDPALNIPWPVRDPILSDKDRKGLPLHRISITQLPVFPADEPPRKPSPLDLEEIQQIVALVNEQIKKLPRIAANLVLAEVLTSTEEIASAYRPDMPGMVLDNTTQERMIGWRQHTFNGSPVVGLPELLSVICQWNLTVALRWEKGQPQLVVERQ